MLTAWTNALGWETWGPHGVLGAYFNDARSVIGVSAGLNLTLVGTKPLFPAEVPDGVALPQFSPTVPFPLPHLQVWLRI